MQMLRLIWIFIVQHWFEIVLAAFFGILFESLSLNSYLRAAIRQIKNTLAARSVVRLRKRIKDLIEYKEALTEFASPDVPRLLLCFRYAMLMLTVLCIGAFMLIVNRLAAAYEGNLAWKITDLPVVFLFGVAIVTGISGIQIATPSYRLTVSTLISNIDTELKGLQAKLDAMPQN